MVEAPDPLGGTSISCDRTGNLASATHELGGTTTYRTPGKGDDAATSDTGYSHAEGCGDAIGYAYDGADNLSAITYPDGTEVSYEYDLNDNLIKVTGRKGETTTYEYDALDRPVAVHLPDGISTYRTYDARDQVTELTTSCDDCGWILGHYAYTYDDRGYLIAEHTEEAREMDPYGRQPHTPYRPEEQGKDCDHRSNRSLSYYLLVQDRAYTYDDAGKLIYATETEAGCGTTSWRYAYDLMGNRILEEKKNPGGKVVESNHFVYNESSQMTEATLCDGRATRKVCYTYDGDGNRAYQVSYNPDKDEDFSCYYRTYDSCDYDGTGIQLRAAGEVSPTEEGLIKLIAPAGATLTSRYELIEYVNDVNREYVEALVEQNINGRTDTTYTYGVDRISRELFDQTDRTSYYLYDPRGSVAGLADAKGHLTRTYQYSVTGEPTYGAAAYENEYAYNGESYSPNIHSQYLRARYYSVATASFLTEDSYLGSIWGPLTLNRYNYCISSYPNYEDPSGNLPWRDLLQDSARTAPPVSFHGRDYGWAASRARGMAEANLMALLEIPEGMGRITSTVGDFFSGIGASAYRNAAQAMGQEAALLGSALDFFEGYPASYRKSMEQVQKKVALYEEGKAREAESMTAFYAGKCTGDVLSAAFVLISAAQAPDAGGQGWAGSTVSKAQLVTVDGRAVEVELAGGRALVGVLGLAPSYSPSGVGDDFRNVWASVRDSKALQGRSNPGGELPEGGSSKSGTGKGEGKLETGKNGTYEKADYHSGQTTGRKNPAPKDGQFALDNSVPIGENTSRRVGLDRNGDFVVLDETKPGTFHGHIRAWNNSSGNQGLTQEMRTALYRAGYVKSPTGSKPKLTDCAIKLLNQ